MNHPILMENLRTIMDFPIEGIVFRDLSTLFRNPESLHEMTTELYDLYKDKGITKIVGLESRGFIMAPILSEQIGAGMVLCRKPGKLPFKTVSESYKKEYGVDSLEIQVGDISEDDVVLIHDDLLASGGTIKAAIDLVKKFHPKKIYVNFIIELVNLNGRKRLEDDLEVTTLMQL